MKVYGTLDEAQLQNNAGALTGNVSGRIYYNTTSKRPVLDADSLHRAFLVNDQNCIFGNNGTAANNVRLNRAANAVLQLVTGDDTTAEGSISTSLGQLSFKFESYATGSLPAAGVGGRLLYDSTLNQLKLDNGSALSALVTLTNAVTLTDKTLTSPAINGANFNFGTASNSNRLLLPNDTTTNLGGLTNTAGLIAYDTSLQKPVYNDGSGWQSIGSGTGSLDVVYSETFEIIVAANWQTGDNATFMTSPTSGLGGISGTLALPNTSSPLRGSNDLKYTQGASSLNDYLASPEITISEKMQNNFIGIVLGAVTYNGDDGDIVVVLYDETNNVVLSDDTWEIQSSSTSKRHVFNVYIPDGVTSLRWGFHTKVLNSGKVLQIKDVELTTNPFVISDFDNIGAWETCTFTGTWVSNTAYTAKRRQNGEMMQYQVRIACSGAPTATDLFLTLPTDDTIDTAKLMSIADLDSVPSIVHINDTGTNRFNGSISYRTTTSVRVRCEVSSGTFGYHGGVDASNPMTFANTDYILCYFEVPLTRLQAKTEHIVTPTSMSQPAKVTANDTTAITGAGTLTFIGFGTTEFDRNSRFVNVASANNVTYTSTTYYLVENDDYYEISTQLYSGDVDLDADEAIDLYLTKNGSGNVLARKKIDIESSLAAPSYIFEISTLVYLNRGDKISVALSCNTTGDISLANSANLSHFTVKQVSTTPVLGGLPVTNGYIRLRTANGHGSTNTCIRRFTTTVSSIGNAITFADSATLGSTLTINEKGIYSITYTGEARAGGNAPMGLSLNSSQLTTSIASITDADRLALFDTSAGTFRGHVNWTGYLDVGDVIRAHTAGTMDATTTVGFTIAKLNFRT